MVVKVQRETCGFEDQKYGRGVPPGNNQDAGNGRETRGRRDETDGKVRSGNRKNHNDRAVTAGHLVGGTKGRIE